MMNTRTWTGWRVAAAVGVLGLAGCGTIGGGGTPRVGSAVKDGGVLTLDLPTRVFTSTDRNTADLYMTNLPAGVWREGMDVSGVSGVSGVIVHVHLFMSPKAGQTPISQASCTASVRVVVVANGEIGVYGGGGFVMGSGSAKGSSLSGRIGGGTVRLTRATPGFEDPMGPGVFEGGLSGRRDEREAMLIARALGALASYGEVVEPQPLVAVKRAGE